MSGLVPTVAWWCTGCGLRHELPTARSKRCPECDTKLRRVSRYEWFLEDALSDLLDDTERDYTINPQYPIHDHRGFDWFWDLGVWVRGASPYGGAGVLIDVNGPDHESQKRYSGPGGGYTRDYDKTWELGQQAWHKRGWAHIIILNEYCRQRVVYQTARQILYGGTLAPGMGGPGLIHLADHHF